MRHVVDHLTSSTTKDKERVMPLSLLLLWVFIGGYMGVQFCITDIYIFNKSILVKNM